MKCWKNPKKSGLDITLWLQWFLACLDRSLEAAARLSSGVLYKSRYWEYLSGKTLNDRQRRIINMLLDGKFFGKLTSSKWAKLMKCSQDTALRDIQSLIEQGILEKENAGGRSTGYKLADIPEQE